MMTLHSRSLILMRGKEGKRMREEGERGCDRDKLRLLWRERGGLYRVSGLLLLQREGEGLWGVLLGVCLVMLELRRVS